LAEGINPKGSIPTSFLNMLCVLRFMRKLAT